jgi:O-antigen/teichoic acid export membrane protein
MLGAMTILADGGIASAVMAQGSKDWDNKMQLGVIVSTGLMLRKKLAIISIIVCIPILLYLSYNSHFNLFSIIIIAISIIPSFIMSLSGTLYEVAIKLKQDIIPLQRNQFTVSILRLLLLLLLLLIFPYAFIAILAAGLPQIWANQELKKISIKYADLNQNPSEIVEKNIIKIIKRVLPTGIYQCLSSQITIWIVTLLGSTSNIAKLGALGRIIVSLRFFNIIINTVVLPRFAKIINNEKIIASRYTQIIGGLILMCLVILSVVWMFSSEILLLLGENYLNLKNELLLSCICGLIALITWTTNALSISRGWAINPLLSIPVNILSIIVGVIFIDLKSLSGVIVLDIFVTTIQCLLQIGYFIKCIKIK